MIGVFFYAPEYQRQHELPGAIQTVASGTKVAERGMYEQRESEKRIIRNSNDRRKGTDQSDVCTDDTVRSQSQKTYAKVRGEGRAMMRHTGIHMNQYLRAAGNDLESFRIRLKETHLPDELQPKAGGVSGSDGTYF